MSRVLTDAQWASIEPMLPKLARRGDDHAAPRWLCEAEDVGRAGAASLESQAPIRLDAELRM